MAVTITEAQLRAALHLGDTQAEVDDAVRLLAYATTTVIDFAPSAPDIVHNESAVRLAGYLFDAPNAASLVNPLGLCGAARMLFRWKVAEAVTTHAAVAAASGVGSAGNPVVGIDVSGVTLTVTFADGTVDVHTLPAGGTGGVDQTARDAAANAQTTADEATTPAEAAALVSAGVLNFAEDRAGITAVAPADRITDAADGLFLAREGNAIIGKPLPGDTVTPRVAELEDTALVDLRFQNDGARVTLEQADGGTIQRSLNDTNRPAAWAHRNPTALVPTARLNTPDLQQIATDQILRHLITVNPNGVLPVATEAHYNEGAVAARGPSLYHVVRTGHTETPASWTWGNLADTDLAQYRGVTDEPLDIPNPNSLDWAFFTGDHGRRWIRYVGPPGSGTWAFSSDPVGFEDHYVSQSAAQSGGIVAVGTFIYDAARDRVRIIRSYTGAAVGTLGYDWAAASAGQDQFARDAAAANADDIAELETDFSDVEGFALRSSSAVIKTLKHAEFAQSDLNAIPDGGEQIFVSEAAVRKSDDGSATVYDLATWIPKPAPVPGGGGGAGQWYYLAQGRFNSGVPAVAGSSVDMTLQAGPWGTATTLPEMQALLANGTIRMLAVYLEEIDQDVGDSDTQTTILPNVANAFGLIGTSAVVFDAFMFGSQPNKLSFDMGLSTVIRMTPDFAQDFSGGGGIFVRLAVFA